MKLREREREREREKVTKVSKHFGCDDTDALINPFKMFNILSRFHIHNLAGSFENYMLQRTNKIFLQIL